MRAASISAGYSLNARQLTVNLSPAAIPKHGTGFDLGIAVAVLAACDEVPADAVRPVAHLAELGLDGRLRHVTGVLPAVLAAQAAGCDHVVVAPDDVGEARLVEGVRVSTATTLGDLVLAYRSGRRAGERLPEAPEPSSDGPPRSGRRLDLAEVSGQHEARTALMLAAAGGHHLLLNGPPGSGKTMLAERLVTILPPLTREQALETLAVRSLVGAAPPTGLDVVPPFVAPHHSASVAALVGGGSALVLPGALSQAHHGVLFLDEASNGKCTSFSKEVTDEDDYEAAWRERATGAGDAGGGLPGVLSDGAGRAGRGHAVDLSVSAAVEVSQGQGGCDRASAP